MLTVKHIFHRDETGPHVENLYECGNVHFCGDTPSHIGALELRTGDTENAVVAGLWGGVAYVMNEAGKTIARYDLPRFDGAAKPELLEDPTDYPPGDPEAYQPD